MIETFISDDLSNYIKHWTAKGFCHCFERNVKYLILFYHIHKWRQNTEQWSMKQVKITNNYYHNCQSEFHYLFIINAGIIVNRNVLLIIIWQVNTHLVVFDELHNITNIYKIPLAYERYTFDLKLIFLWIDITGNTF